MVYTVFQEIDSVLIISLLVQGLILIVMWALLHSISKHTKNLDRFDSAMETISNQLDTIGKIVSFTSSANVADELKKLTELRNANSLTEEEFAHQRKKLLANDILTSQNRLSKDITFRCSRCDNQFKVKEGMQYPEHCPHCGYISS